MFFESIGLSVACIVLLCRFVVEKGKVGRKGKCHLFQEANFVLSFSPLHHGRNDLDIHTVKAPKSTVSTILVEFFLNLDANLK